MKTERLYHACAGNSPVSQKFGPFATAEEAESHAARLGWGWVLVEATTTEGGKTEVNRRYYRPDKPWDAAAAATESHFAPEGFAPPSEEEVVFLAEYERQLTSKCAECGEEIAPGEAFLANVEHIDGRKETLAFHSEFGRMCVDRWTGKRLESAKKNIRKMLEASDGKAGL